MGFLNKGRSGEEGRKARPLLCGTLGYLSKALQGAGGGVVAGKERLSAMMSLGDPVTCCKQKQYYRPRKGPELGVGRCRIAYLAAYKRGQMNQEASYPS